MFSLSLRCLLILKNQAPKLLINLWALLYIYILKNAISQVAHLSEMSAQFGREMGGIKYAKECDLCMYLEKKMDPANSFNLFGHIENARMKTSTCHGMCT